MNEGVKASKAWPIWGLVIGISGCLIMFRKLLGGGELGLWADSFDANLMVYIFEWGRHALVDLGTVTRFFDANIFYPMSRSLAVSDSFLSAQVFYVPLRSLGLGILPSLYLTLASVTLMGAVLTDRALLRWGLGAGLDRALVIVAAHFSLPATVFLFHYQCFGWQLAPPFFLHLCLYLRDFRRSDLIITVLLYAFAASWATYLAPMLLVLGLPLMVGPLVREMRQHGLRAFIIERVGLINIMIVAAILGALFYIQMWPYLEFNRHFPPPTFDEAKSFSARFRSLFQGYSIQSYWYNPGGYANGDWERAYFPGYLLLVALALTILLAWARRLARRATRSWPRVLSQPLDLELRGLVGAMGILFFGAWILSFGPFNRGSHTPLPFWVLSHVIPGLKNIRAPGRFGIFLGLPLGLFVVYGLHVLVRGLAVRRALTVLVLGLIVVESWPDHKIHPFSLPHEAEYRSLAEVITPGTPLLELPIMASDYLVTLKNVMNQMKGSTIHWARIVGGYGAKDTEQFRAAMHLDAESRRGHKELSEVVAFARSVEIEHILIHLDQMEPAPQAAWQRLAADAELVSEARRMGDSLLLKLVPRGVALYDNKEAKIR